MIEPFYLVQTVLRDAPQDERQGWFGLHIKKARSEGAQWVRMSHHPEQTDLLLLEAWHVRPDNEGEPRFQMVEG